MNKHKLIEVCSSTLKQNDLGGWTRPAPGLYPHQWLWDSCFIAIGLRHINVKRAQKEIKNLFRGQWKNGMLPHIIMKDGDSYSDKVWDSSVSKNAPKHVNTSGITQPPMVAEAIARIGESLTRDEKIKWYRSIFDDLVSYHEWLYRERDPHCEGLVVNVHPWETGLDNNPAWMREMSLYETPRWIKAVRLLHLDGLFEKLRKDTRYVPAIERIDTIDALNLFSKSRKLKRAKYSTRLVLRRSNLLVEDVAFNSILIRANEILEEIAHEIRRELPGWLHERFKKARHALELLRDDEQKQYFCRNFQTFELIDEPSIETFLPLYAGSISKARAKELVELLKSSSNWLHYPVPSAPKNSRFFNHHRYWQGPSWVNTNWLIIDGLKRYGFIDEALLLKEKTLQLVSMYGPYEYFSPTDGTPAGTRDFSWSAALAIDLAQY